MDDKLMYNTNDDRQNYPFCTLIFWLKSSATNRVLTYQNSIKVIKVVKPTNIKTWLQYFGY